MRVLVSTYGRRGDTQSLAVLAMPLRELDTVAAEAERCAALMAFGRKATGE
jgi:hypothetical protein